MIRNDNSTRMVAQATGAALVALALTGCASIEAPRADLSASEAITAMAEGEHEEAIEHAEAAVLAEPRNPAFRAMLGAAYLDAGRFHAAATSYADAMALGDESARTALGLALAQTGAGDLASAAALLEDWREDIAPVDLGLAFALAGQPERGVHILSNAIRNGGNTVKARQNLAYAYALQGNWRAARLMVAEDVPANDVGERIAKWASMIRPGYSQVRVATLIGAPVVADSGQPAQLALANFQTIEQLAAEAVAVPGPVSEPDREFAIAETAELPAFDDTAPVEKAATALVAAPAPVAVEPVRLASVSAPLVAASPVGAVMAAVAQQAIRYISSPVVQDIPEHTARPVPAPRQAAAEPAKRDARGGNHLVQLGSFSSKGDARRAWDVFTDRYKQLDDYELVITEARVKGKTYFRVSAGGLQQNAAVSMCRTVKARGEGCITWAAGSPLPGAVDNGVRVAKR